MARYTTVEYFKHHSYVNPQGCEDDYIEALLDASEVHTEKILQRKLEKYADAEGNLPSDLAHAIIVYAATQFENREAVSPAEIRKVPMSYFDMVVPYINKGQYKDDEEEG